MKGFHLRYLNLTSISAGTVYGFNVRSRSHRCKDVKSDFTVPGFRSVLMGTQLLTTACDTTVITEEPLSPNTTESFPREYWLVKSSCCFKITEENRETVIQEKMNVK